MNQPAASATTWRTPMVILIGGGVCVLMAFGLRGSLGLFLKPMSLDLGWGREVFALALALQNLIWGAIQPFAAAAAEKWGAGRVIALGGILYGAGLYLMASASDPLSFHLTAGLMIGLAQSASALAVVLGAVGRMMPAEKRTFGLGIITAAGAAGQFTVVPVGQVFLTQYGWATSLVLLAAMAVVIVVVSPVMKGRVEDTPKGGDGQATLGAAVAEAARHRGFWLLTAGFFVCGFHVAFVGVHLPAYLADAGMPPETGAWSLALIGLFNVIGCFAAGYLGDRRRKKYLLSWLYILRSVVFVGFILTPISTTSVIIFSVTLGLLWLSTVPLTSGLVGQIFGPRYMGTLFAIVFFNHQVGSFLGIWLGGYYFDAVGSYMPVWWAGVVLGLASALLHWPINDKTMVQPANA